MRKVTPKLTPNGKPGVSNIKAPGHLTIGHCFQVKDKKVKLYSEGTEDSDGCQEERYDQNCIL